MMLGGAHLACGLVYGTADGPLQPVVTALVSKESVILPSRSQTLLRWSVVFIYCGYILSLTFLFGKV